MQSLKVDPTFISSEDGHIVLFVEKNAKVTIITTYRIYKYDIKKTGINTFAAQQWNQLEQQG